MRIDGRDTEVKVPLGRSALTESLAARAWAETFAADLLGESDEAAQRVVFALSRHFFLANDFASFLILETDEEYRQYGSRTSLWISARSARRWRQARARAGRAASRSRGSRCPTKCPAETIAARPQPRLAAADAGVAGAFASPRRARARRVLLQQPRVGRDADTPAAIYRAARGAVRRRRGRGSGGCRRGAQARAGAGGGAGAARRFRRSPSSPRATTAPCASSASRCSTGASTTRRAASSAACASGGRSSRRTCCSRRSAKRRGARSARPRCATR